MIAALTALPQVSEPPVMMHVHDWHAALAPAYLRALDTGKPFFTANGVNEEDMLPVGVETWAVETSYDLDAVLPKAEAEAESKEADKAKDAMGDAMK